MTLNRVLALIAAVLLTAGCSREAAVASTTEGRWYTTQQLENGKVVFMTHCATCHGAKAEATPDWRETEPDGNYPPPPLNGSAHAWHHSLDALRTTIRAGGVPFGGTMTGFGDTLTNAEILAAIAYFQSFWSDEIYVRWRAMNARTR